MIHQFAPIDNIKSVRKFLNHWKPSVCLISELDLWPIRIIEAKNYGIKMFLFNSRMNKKKRNDRLKFSSILAKTLTSFDAIFLQDDASINNFRSFGVPREKISVCGSFKAAGSVLAKDYRLIEKLKSWSNGKLVWIAASIHEDEEAEILEAFIKEKNIPNLILIIAPRSLESVERIEKKLYLYSIESVTRRLKNEFPKVDTEIMLVSTVGEMGSFYNQSDIAFIGNSLDFERIKTGKNPFEAIQEKCVVIHGPKMLEPSYAEILKLGISQVVFNKDDISEALLQNVSKKEREIKIKRLDLLEGNKKILTLYNETNELNKKGDKSLVPFTFLINFV